MTADLQRGPNAHNLSANNLSAHRLTQVLGGQTVLDRVSAQAQRGQLTAIIGPNGAGKSSLLRLLAGLDRPVSGQVLLDTQPLLQVPRSERARRLAFLAQSEPLPADMPVQDAVLLGLGAGGWLGGLLSLGQYTPQEEDTARRTLQQMGLEPLACRRVGQLSGGEAQRVALARALVATPEFLLLDEPTNHLDLGHAVVLLGQLRKLAAGGLGSGGLGAVAVLHDLNLAAFADVIWLLDGGRLIAAGPPATVLTTSNIRAVYGLEADILQHQGRVVVVPNL